MKNWMQTATVAAGTAAITSAVISMDHTKDQSMENQEKPELTTNGLFGGTLLAPGMTEEVAMQPYDVGAGMAGTVKTVERAVFSLADVLSDYGINTGNYFDVGVNDVNLPYENSTLDTHIVSRDGEISRLSVVSRDSGFQGYSNHEYTLEIFVNFGPAIDPININPCTDGSAIVELDPPIQVMSGDEIFVRVTVGPACDGSTDPDIQFGPIILDIEREVDVNPAVPGDVNGDGVVNFTDLVATLSLFTEGNRSV